MRFQDLEQAVFFGAFIEDDKGFRLRQSLVVLAGVRAIYIPRSTPV